MVTVKLIATNLGGPRMAATTKMALVWQGVVKNSARGPEV